MIKFFRSIRQKLLAENKMMRYLIYAAGEIILVVIGILIALSINNWNQSIIDNKAETYYLDQMKNDLITDSLFLSGVASNLEDRLPVIRNFLKVLHEESSKESFNSGVTQYMNTVLVPIFFVSNSTTFNEMESSGKLGIIRDKELRKNIISVYNHLDVTKNIFSLNYDFMGPVDRKLISGRGMAKYQKYQDDLFASYVTQEEIYKLKDIKDELESNIANWNWTILDMQPPVKAQLNELRGIITQIEDYLK